MIRNQGVPISKVNAVPLRFRHNYASKKLKGHIGLSKKLEGHIGSFVYSSFCLFIHLSCIAYGHEY